MELLVGGNIISLDLSISQVYEQVWRKHHSQTQHALSNASSLTAASSGRDCPPMTVTYRLQVRVKVSFFFFASVFHFILALI
jgi:E3 ubiquitin-protein ligase UBR4